MAFIIRSDQLGAYSIPATATQSVADLPTATFKLPPLGTRVTAFDPVFGEAEFVLAFGVASGTAGDAVRYNPFTGATTRCVAGTRGLIGVMMASNTNTAALGWLAVRGTVPVRANAAIAVNSVLYQTAGAGAVDDAVVAGDAIVGAVSSLATSATVTTLTGTTVNGSPIVRVDKLDGLFIGATVTGTGIPASTTIAAIGYGGIWPGQSPLPDAYTITMSANATASGTVTVTVGTGTGYALASLHYPVAQGAV